MSKFLLIYGYQDFEYQIVSVNEDWELEYSLYDDSNKKFDPIYTFPGVVE